ncbi:dienelactone hydrolase family protein [Herbiconiux sp. VKM Ac-1786]|jgi:carboxymethylenebutenolidase|uniref:dienelactone hydrolase family protein n=1 Tax=Herbiconiux sp. VKM Ac-1786 TaxID=2783824 RepID=UPI00188C5017|nr:dienelactone hydrolase family protein [Herbiconiux sp. VKM Ac-1786]MBF4572291.1 dienelactone hydrolase family protein [Herbiconiux sp. VKM Ac-1786]
MPAFIDIPSPGWPLQFGEAGNPAVVIVHDAYGRLPYLEAYARALAGQGFFVVVPDLFDGVATIEADGAAELEGRLDPGFALATLDDAVALARTPDGPGTEADSPADRARVGLIGLGLGGRYALRLAQRGSADAVVAYHALLGDDEGGVIPAPVLLHRAENTAWAGGVDVDGFVSRLKEHGTPVTQHSYAGTSAGFANATVLPLVDRNAAALAFARSTYFLQAQLLD